MEAGNLLYLSGNEVWSYDGATSTSLATFPTSGTALTFDFDDADFWVASGTSNLSASFGWVQVPRDGSAVTNFGTEMAAQDVLPHNLRLLSTHIAWSRAKFGSPPNSPDLWWVPRTGGDATQYLLPDGQSVTGFDVLGDELYFVVAVNQNADFIQKMVVDGTPTHVLDLQGMAGGGLYVDPQHLYYSTYDGSLWRADLDGTNAVALQDVRQTTRIYGCDEYVLFDDATMGTAHIYVIVKD